MYGDFTLFPPLGDCHIITVVPRTEYFILSCFNFELPQNKQEGQIT